MKKLRFILIALFILAAAFAVYLFLGKKTDVPSEGYYTYTVTDGKATIKDCDPALSGNVTIPAKLGGFPVTSIAGYAFDGCSQITSINLPDSISELQMYAFENCSGLTTIRISRSVTLIDGDIFGNCSNLSAIWVDSKNEVYSSDSFGVLYNKEQTKLIRAPMNLNDPYSIPDSVQSIGERAFSGCKNLLKITIPEGITSIDWYTFSGCTSLTTITIPSSLTNVGDAVFHGCNKLSDVRFKGSEEDWDALNIKSGNGSLTSADITYNYCDHLWDDGVITKSPTCKESGIRVFTCNLCGETEMKAIAKLTEHTWNKGAVTRVPTCKEAGVKTYTCTVCNTTRTESIAILTTHTWNSGVATKEPTCNDTGVMTYTCRICGTTKEESIEMLPTHTPGPPATGTEDQICTVCGKVLVPATGETEPPDPTEPPVVTEPTPTEPVDDSSSRGFFSPIIDFFNAIAEFFQNLFAPLLKLFGL